LKNNKLKKEKNININGKKVLVVDDSELNVQITKEILLKNGFYVDSASSGREAYNKARKNEYDLILMDIGMPEWDGYVTTKKIRLIEGYEEKPIIALTAKFMTSDKNKSMSAGLNDHISKPVEPEVLLDIIYQYVLKENIKGKVDNIDYSDENIQEKYGEFLEEDININDLTVIQYKDLEEKFELLSEYIRKNQPKPCRKIFEILDDLKMPFDIEYMYKKLKISIDRFDFKNAEILNNEILSSIDHIIGKKVGMFH